MTSPCYATDFLYLELHLPFFQKKKIIAIIYEFLAVFVFFCCYKKWSPHTSLFLTMQTYYRAVLLWETKHGSPWAKIKLKSSRAALLLSGDSQQGSVSLFSLASGGRLPALFAVPSFIFRALLSNLCFHCHIFADSDPYAFLCWGSL